MGKKFHCCQFKLSFIHLIELEQTDDESWKINIVKFVMEKEREISTSASFTLFKIEIC